MNQLTTQMMRLPLQAPPARCNYYVVARGQKLGVFRYWQDTLNLGKGYSFSPKIMLLNGGSST
jgi:hypothetical protein